MNLRGTSARWRGCSPGARASALLGGVRRSHGAHPAISYVEKVQVLALATGRKACEPHL